MDIPEEIINSVTASVLFAAARESDLTQNSLAARAGMSKVTVQKVLSGNQGIKVAQFVTLARATDLSPSEIMERIEVAVARRLKAHAQEMSAGLASLDSHRASKQREALEMSPQDLEQLEKRAATDEAELGTDEPDVP